MITVQRSLARNLVLSPYIQLGGVGSGGAALTDAQLTRRQPFDVSGVLGWTPTRRDDSKYGGKGTPFSSSSQTTRRATDFTLKGEIDDWLIGFLLSLWGGQDVVTGPVAGAYTHVLNYLVTFASTMPMTTFYLEDTNDLTRLVPDMALKTLTLTFPKAGAATFEAQFIGSGVVTPHTMGAMPAVPAVRTFFLAEEGVTTFGPVGGLLPFGGRMESLVLKLDTGAMGFSAMGDGGTFPFIRQGIPTIGYQATIAANATDDIETLIANDTAVGVTHTFAPSAGVGLTIGLPNFNLKAAKMGSESDMTIWNIEADQTSIQPPAGGTSPINLTVVNSVPSYLIAA